MAGDPGSQNDPCYDLLTNFGRDEFQRLFNAEVRTMADTSSKGSTYRTIRRAAVDFIETHYTELQYDALIPYMAMTLVDRVYLVDKIPTILKSSPAQNVNLFFICCLLISWKLRSKRLDVPNVLRSTGLEGFTIEDVIAMEVVICRRLDWRLRPVMPFRFIDFFAPFLTLEPSPSALKPVYQLIVTSQFDTAFTHFRPSVMAYSAMLVYTTNELPNQLDTFKNSITNCGNFVKLQAKIDRCQRMLELLYRTITDAAPSDAPPSTGAGTKKSEPIPIESTSKAEGKRPINDDDDEEASDQEGKEITEEKFIQRKGKEIARDDDDIEWKQDIWSRCGAYDFIADLMSFPLGWKEAQAKAAGMNLGAPTSDRSRCNIL